MADQKCSSNCDLFSLCVIHRSVWQESRDN